MEGDKKRLVARKICIKELLNSRYFKEDGLRPNYILTQEDKKISRINLIGIVVLLDKSQGFGNFLIDDGSGKITIRFFEEREETKDISIGDSVLIIGRPREYGGEIYVLPEIFKKVGDISWLEIRKLELREKKEVEKTETPQEVIEETVEEYVQDTGIKQKVYDLIKQKDNGQGVPYEEVITKIGGADGVIKGMIETGEVFEVTKGKLKVV